MRTRALQGRLRVVVLIGFVAALAPFGVAAPAGAGVRTGVQAPGADPGVTMTELPEVNWVDINDRGQLVGTTNAAPPDQRLMLWHRGTTTDIGPYALPPNPYCVPQTLCMAPSPGGPRINDRGQVATYRDGHAVIVHDGRLTDLDGDADYSWLLGFDDRGDALMMRFADADPAVPGFEAQTLGLWSRGRFTELHVTERSTAPWVRALLSRRGHVVVRTYDTACPCWTPFLWHRGTRTDLPPGLFPVDVNGRGQVLGSWTDPATGESGPVVWGDGRVTRLPTFEGEQTYPEGINDRGQIVGLSVPPGTTNYRAVLWDDGAITDIGADTGAPSTDPREINERGDVLVGGNAENGRSVAFLWRGGEAVPLPPVDEPWTAVEAFGLNERGQVFGRYAPVFQSFVWTLWQIDT